MRLSQRLLSVANETLYETLADIGTDHAFVPIYLINEGKIKKALACDVSKGSLEKARINIEQTGLEKQISARLSDGLKAIKPHEAETVILAGMGGMLINDILNQSPLVLETVKQLILQPQKDLPQVRKCIHTLGFKIVNEIMLFEAGVYYNILNCHRGSEIPYSEREYLFGKILIERKDKVLKEYLQFSLKKLRSIKQKINPETLNAKNRLDNADREISEISEVLECL